MIPNHPLEHVPLKSKIWLSKYETSGELTWKDVEANSFKIMVVQDDKLECWSLYYDEKTKQLVKYDDIITVDISNLDS